jgi:protocatechuate 3,4-dioxygenase beta subunit
MKTTRQFLLVSAAGVLLSVSVCAQTQMRLQSVIQRVPNADTDATAQKTNDSGTVTNAAAAKFFRCFGTVTDAGGRPVADATVEYWRYAGRPSPENRAELKKQTNSSASGAFELPVSRNVAQLVARKPGFAPAWTHLNPRKDTEVHLVLTPPAALAGVVMDESGKPVADAEVVVAAAMHEDISENGGRSADYLSGKPARDAFNARTGADGHFRIEGFPTNATADLAVRVPGKALRQAQPQPSSGPPSLPYTAAQNDIRLVIEPAGTVEGAVVFEGSVRPFPPVQLMLLPDQPGLASMPGREPATSDADGAFRIADVAVGTYRLRADFGTNATAHWVAESVPVSVDSRQVTRGVQVAAIRGALLEVAVLQGSDRQPQARVAVNAYKENFQATATTGSNGIARLWLPPGDYQVAAMRKSGPPDQTTATVEAGRTNREEIVLAGPKKITGVVHLPDGQPAASLPVRLVGAYGPGTTSVKTDNNGRFEWEWNPRQYGQNDISICLLVRDAEHNLAVAQEIDEETGPLDLKLEPGLTLAGRAECDGKPVTNATAALVFWTGRRGMWLQDLARSNAPAPGQYEIPALPPGRRYGVIVSAPGYGQRQMQNLDLFAEAGRQELDKAELMPATLKLAGQVLDAEDKPVAGVYVNLHGGNQPDGNVQTDREGRFSFEHVCEGRVQLSANNQKSYGNVTAEGGDTNVILHLGQTISSGPDSISHKLRGTVTDPDGKPVAGAQVAVFPANGPHWTRTGTNGSFNLTWSLQSWQLQSGGPVLVARDTTRNLAAIEDLPEDATILDLKLAPALTVRGQVKNVDDSPLPGAQVGVWIKTGNRYEQLNEQLASTDAQGRYEIKCLPADAQYIAFVSAKGHGRGQQPIQSDSETNRLELAPFVLKPANQIVAGQVLNENEKPVAGVNVSLSGEDQPNDNAITDSKGRFRLQVCEGQVRLFANSQNSFAQATAEAGDTNVVLTLGSQSGDLSPAPRRAALKGKLLPDLTSVNLAADAASAQKPVLLCLFDAGQRPSRHVLRQLNEQAAALRQRGVLLLGVQAAVIDDETFNAWKAASPVSFPVGRVTEKSEKSRWATNVNALPWMILADAGHKVVAEGFSLDDLDGQLKALAK